MKFEIGDIIVAINNKHGITSKKNGFEGKVIELRHEHFTAETIEGTYCNVGSNWDGLLYGNFELKHKNWKDRLQ